MLRLRESVRITLKLLEHEAFGPIVAERLQPKDDDLATDENLDRWIRKTVFNTTHASGTCKMGPALDPMAVVDQRLNFHGLLPARMWVFRGGSTLDMSIPV